MKIATIALTVVGLLMTLMGVVWMGHGGWGARAFADTRTPKGPAMRSRSFRILAIETRQKIRLTLLKVDRPSRWTWMSWVVVIAPSWSRSMLRICWPSS